MTPDKFLDLAINWLLVGMIVGMMVTVFAGILWRLFKEITNW